MSATASQSPLPGPTLAIDETKLPQGQCRFILLNPEIKGQRCACVCFTLNRTLPSVTCECGHQSCYHIQEPEAHPDAAQIERLQHRIQRLEEQLDREQQGSLGSTIAAIFGRLGDLEEHLEKSRDEVSHDVKGIYGQIKRVWQSVDQNEKNLAGFGRRLDGQSNRSAEHDDTLAHLDERIRQCDENTIDLADRLDCIEELEDSSEIRPVQSQELSASEPLRLPTSDTARANSKGLGISVGSAQQPSGEGQPSSTESESPGNGAALWTVHISLLPTTTQPFPFEKDTTAYKRCLSRGLHQMVAVRGADSDAVARAVEKAFGQLLKGRAWVPLKARLCEAESLLGLPMLRPLDENLVDAKNYDQDFLRQHCAVCGPNGKIDSLYIAMESDRLSWHSLRRSPCLTEDLEESWLYDPLLDPNDPIEDDSMDEDDRPSAGDIVPPIQLSLKRTASDMSRTPSFSAGSSGDSLGNRPKIARTGCVPVPVEMRRRLETV